MAMMNCPHCGNFADPRLERCPHCGGGLQARASAAPGTKSRTRQTCPNCKAMVQEGDIICVVCGTNLLTGQKVSEERKPSKNAASNRRLLVVAGSALVLLAAAVAAWMYISTRDPVRLALEMVERGDQLQAQESLMAYMERQPDDSRAQYTLGRIQYMNGAFMPAAQSFEQVVNRDARNTDAALWAVACYQSAGGAANRDRQASLLEKVTSVKPDDQLALYLLGLARGAQGNTEGQIEILRRIVTISPANTAAQWGLGLGLALETQYREAAAELAQVAAAGETPEVLAAEGMIRALSGEPDAARERLIAALASPALSIRWHVSTELGRLLLEQGQFREAEQYLRDAATQRDAGAEARYLFALALEAQGLPQQSLKEFDALSRESGEFSGRAAIRAAAMNLLLDNPASAQSALERADTAARATAPYHTLQGRILAAGGDFDGAQNAYRHSIEVDANYAPAHLESALVYIRSQALVEGQAALERYVALMGADFRGPQADQIRELLNQLKQTTGREA